MNRTYLSIVAVFGVAGACVLPALADGQIPDRATLDAILGGNQVLEHFESFDIGDGAAVVLDTAVLDDQTIANGQGPGLVEDGATYTGSNGDLQWNGNNYYEIPTRTLLGNTDTFEIAYDPVVTAMGLNAYAYVGFGYSGSMSVYDVNNALIGTIDFSINAGGAETVFLGWENSAGISRVVLDEFIHGWCVIINDHGYGTGGDIYTLRVTGRCPGRLTISWSGADVGVTQGLVYGDTLGSTRIPNGYPCTGTTLGVSGRVRLVDPPGYFGTGSGQGSITGNAGTGACGHFLQLVQGGSCTVSNTAPIP